jgi:hypothetical protein
LGIRYGAVGIAAAIFWSLLARIPVMFVWSTASTAVRQSDLYAAQIAPLLGAGAVAAETAVADDAAILTSCLTQNGRHQVRELAGFGWGYLGRLRRRK